MVILGINANHCATACILVDGEIKACVSEERLTRVKNQRGVPILAAKEALSILGLTPSDVDSVIIGFKDPKINSCYSSLAQAARVDSKNRSLASFMLEGVWFLKENLLTKIPQSGTFYNKVVSQYYKYFVDQGKKEEVLSTIENKLKIPREKVTTLEHHLAHACAPYYSFPKYSAKPRLVLTLDGQGDGLCATVSVAKNGKITRISETPAGASLADVYSFVTGYLGMKMGEHEYKVMGLSGYANKKHIEKIYKKFKDLIWVNPDLTFSAKSYTCVLYKVIPSLLINERFDDISGAIQKLTEDLMVEWVRKAIKKTGIHDVMAGGGVFMNVKASQKIAALPEVASLYVMPSCGDESTAIGAAYWAYNEAKKKDNTLPDIKPLKDLYLGREFSDQEIARELTRQKSKKFVVKKIKNIEKTIARLLKDGEVVARLAGSMEWGARSLGNRSILADPSNLNVVRVINEQIKSRDFWMPFAPSMLKEKAGKYVVNPKKIDAPYMIISFDSTDLGKQKFKAAMHQYDFTLRPQFVDKSWNPSYWKVIKEFEKLTGIGGVLNTSFNLHGYPIVYTPGDAMYVFKNSDLRYLALGNYLVSKK